MIREVAEKSKHQLALSGKLMGLCGYGKTNYDMVPAFEEFFFDRDYEKLSNWTNLPLKNIKNLKPSSTLAINEKTKKLSYKSEFRKNINQTE